MSNQLLIYLSTLGPIGKNFPAPGTFGSIVGLLTVVFLSWQLDLAFFYISFFFIPLIIVGIPICNKAEQILGTKDPSEIIWDEFTSVPLVFIGLPIEEKWDGSPENILWLMIGFLLFRLFDIKKPLGIYHVQKYKNGIGVMIDDVLAAIYSGFTLYLLHTFSLSFS
mgnify:FL=1